MIPCDIFIKISHGTYSSILLFIGTELNSSYDDFIFMMGYLKLNYRLLTLTAIIAKIFLNLICIYCSELNLKIVAFNLITYYKFLLDWQRASTL